MPMFVHLAALKNTDAILRAGIRLPRDRPRGARGVYAMPVLPSFYVSHQWLRELKRGGQRTLVAVHFRLPDEERVEVGHYNREHVSVSAAEAVGIIMAAPDAAGYEVVIPRAIEPKEIHAIRRVPQVVGWRHYPAAHGRPPCGCPVCLPRGEIKSRRIRDRNRSEPVP